MQKFYDNQISIFITKNVVLHVILLRYSRYANVAIVRLDDILTIYQKKKNDIQGMKSRHITLI